MRMVLALGAGAAMLASCGQPDRLSADHAWVRLSAVSGRPAAGYFTLRGGRAAATLIAVRADAAIKTEMHESMGAGGMATMKPIGQVAVPAGGTVAFAPGGRHVMLFDVNPATKPGGKVTFTYTFADGSRIMQDADVIAAGDPAPK